MKYRILHIAPNEVKFMIPYYDVVSEHFDIRKHKFYLLGNNIEDVDLENVVCLSRGNCIFYLFKLIKDFLIAPKIILHTLQSFDVLLLFFMPWVCKKCYWVIWGSDLYDDILRKKNDWNVINKLFYMMKKRVCKNLGYYITYIKGDYELAVKTFNSSAKFVECLMYTSNVFNDFYVKTNRDENINIQLGNSAASSNNHIRILEELTRFKDKNIRIFLPLSYGEKKYSERVIEKGEKLFGEKFIPLTEFMPYEKYLEFLMNIDIAIFAHRRQQGMGNIINLLGLGKKVYLRSDITPWGLFRDNNVKVYDVKDIQLDLIDDCIKNKNQMKIKKYFSKENYLIQLKNLFKD